MRPLRSAAPAAVTPVLLAAACSSPTTTTTGRIHSGTLVPTAVRTLAADKAAAPVVAMKQ